MAKVPKDAHEWVSFEDPDEQRTWLFDVTFLESNWTCIYGHGCQGVLTGPAEDLVQGCCSYGAHFTDDDDARRVARAAKTLTAEQWQFKDRGKGGVVRTTKTGEKTTKHVKGACIFLNRPGFARGPGCALHVAAMDRGESHVELKPDVCWQLPLRRDDEVLDDGHVITRVTQWERRNWGKGGADFHWWCTEAPEAYVGQTRVVDSMRDELTAMAGRKVVDRLAAYLDDRAARLSVTDAVPLPHPIARRTTRAAGA
jgi:hypothetical protein